MKNHILTLSLLLLCRYLLRNSLEDYTDDANPDFIAF